MESESAALLPPDALSEYLTDVDAPYPAPCDECTRSPAIACCHGPKGESSRPRTAKALYLKRAKELTEEVDQLHRNLKSLLAKHPCGDNSPTRASWKHRAMSEKLKGTEAKDVAHELKKSITANEQFVGKVRRLVNKQTRAIAVLARPRVVITPTNDEAHIYGMLSAVADLRYKQLEANLGSRIQMIQCSSLGSKEGSMPWRVRQHPRGVSMRMTVSTLMPYEVGEYIDSMSQNAQLNKAQRSSEQNGNKVSQYQRSDRAEVIVLGESDDGSSEIDGRRIVRRVLTDYGSVLLWENLSYWQAHKSCDTPSRAIVRESGWSIIAPFSYEGLESTSVSYCNCFVNMYSVDGSKMKKTDPFTKSIIQSIQKLYQQQAQNVENLIISARLRRQQKQQQI